uniref:RNA helicase n=1 Tax=Diabrotica virgifera virgifera TaxID=50390 RepID=A0A6P7FIB9_DIAVI
MGNYISSLLPNNAENDLSLEEAYNILQTNEEGKQKDVENKPSDTIQNKVSAKTGVVTEIRKDSFVIDDIYVCSNKNSNLEIGTKVKFNCFTYDNITKATNVEIFNEWAAEELDSLWYDRIIICQIEQRVGRQLHLTGSEIILDLDKVQLEFLPVVGDWLELDVKCKANEKAFDLAGEVLEINKISPVRLHLLSGKISMWNKTKETGTIDNKIFFNQLSLSLGYLPAIGDIVVAQVIESAQMGHSWRAIKVLPDSVTQKKEHVSSISPDISQYTEHYPGLEIQDVILYSDKLGETQKFNISITNNGENDLTLFSAKFLGEHSQCGITDNVENVTLHPGNMHNILCECSSKSIGEAKESIILNFGGFVLCKSINILVSIQDNNQRTKYTKQTRGIKPFIKPQGQVIRGHGKGVRFAIASLPHYTVPQKLLDVVTSNFSDNIDKQIQEIQSIKPSLTSNLTPTNYEDKFHTLLYLDEISMLISIRKYDQENACFINNGEYLMLEIDNLSEQRPSLAIGDKIRATDPSNSKGVVFEGNIHKISASHVFLKFSPLFHDKYNGEDYSITAEPSRALFKKLHHAACLAIRNLGPELLFPNKIIEKDRQIDFIEKDESLSPNGKKPNRMTFILSKMKEYKENDSLNISDNENIREGVTLEWFNKNLNDTQKNAVMQVLWGTARPLPYIIFGPPGTGKTITLVETILQLTRLIPSSRLLVTAPSNSAANLIALRLIDSGVLLPGDLVRLISYNYALKETIPDKLLPYCATAGLAREDTVVSEVNNPNGIQFGSNMSTLGRSRITVATCSCAGTFFQLSIPRGHFTHIVVDEAAQAGEPHVMIPLSFVNKNSGQIILAGDPMQLGPVILSKVATECGLAESYLERIMSRFPYCRDPEGFPETSGFDPRFVTKLLYNYRALPDILTLYSTLFYHNELIPTIDDETSNEAKLLTSLQDFLPIKRDKLTRILFHGVIGENYQTADSPSWYNPQEVAQVFYYVNQFYRLGVKSGGIGIVTPYIKQAKELRTVFTEAEFEVPKIGTIEEFQGQEFDIVIISTVRSSKDFIKSDLTYHLGFVAHPKRLNVAISRAKSLLLIVGNPKLLCTDPCWRAVVKYCIENGVYKGCDFE